MAPSAMENEIILMWSAQTLSAMDCSSEDWPGV
jgi:hypothetical protein